MLKFPPRAKFNSDIKYANSAISEHVACEIYKSIGIPVQETIVGTYGKDEKQRIVVACKDFTYPDSVVKSFGEMQKYSTTKLR